MKILILGGTAFFGKELVSLFQQAGHDVTVFTRGNAPTTAAHIKGDRKNPDDLKKASAHAKWDMVIDNLAYDGKDMAMSLAAFPGVSRYLMCSTVSVYRFVAPKTSQPLFENYANHDLRPKQETADDVHWKYARGKLDAERALISQTRTPWTIVRPCVIYGPNDTQNRGVWYLLRLMDGEPILLPYGGAGAFRLSYSKDVAKLFLLAAENQKAAGNIYNVVQSEIITLKDFLDESAVALNVPTNYITLPIERVGDELGGPYAHLNNFIPDAGKAIAQLGFKPTPFLDFCHGTAKWFLSDWDGDRRKLLATRPKEIALAKAWASATKSL